MNEALNNILLRNSPRELSEPFPSEDEMEKLVLEAISETEAKEPQDIGKVMGSLKSKIKGNADMGIVSSIVKQKLLG